MFKGRNAADATLRSQHPEYTAKGPARYEDEHYMPGAAVAMSPGQYVATRFSSLKPPLDKLENPIALLRQLTLMNWLNFFVCGGHFEL